MATERQLEALARGREIAHRKAAESIPPNECPECGASMAGKSWFGYLGHLGMHGLAEKYFGGDFEACQRHLMQNGWARQNPIPNAAFKPYIPVTEAKSDT